MTEELAPNTPMECEFRIMALCDQLAQRFMTQTDAVYLGWLLGHYKDLVIKETAKTKTRALT
jgi:hypothetical protein